MEENKVIVIDCQHGKGIASIICGHLLESNQPMGFVENSSDPEDLQGWCYACEHMFQSEKELTERFKKFSSSKVVCEKCYQEIKNEHFVDDETF